MFTLPNLPYDYSSLEPFIDTETMHLHHDKHHAAYVKNLNDLLANHPDLLNMDIQDLILNLNKVPSEIRQKVINNAGGHFNHSLFWTLMCAPTESKVPGEGKLFEAFNSGFENFDAFKEKFSAAALSHFGSGWVWLMASNSESNAKVFEIATTPNQDTPVSPNSKPILCLDIWEHAYYLKYKNVRADYIKAWWNVVNWKEVERLYD